MTTESISFERGRLPVRVGSLLDFPEDPIACMRSLQAEFPDLAVLEENGQRVAFVFSPKYNREVLTNSNLYHSQFFALRGGRRSAQRKVTSGLLSMNGSEHRDSRRAMMDVFKRSILPQYHDTICRLTNEAMSDWEVGQERDLNTEMVHFMLKMTGALLFGINDGDYAVELGNRIDCWVRKNHEVGMGALVSSRDFTEGYDDLLQMADDLQENVQDLLARHKAKGTSKTPDVLSLMLGAQNNEAAFSDEKLIGHVTLTFAAAHLTTAHTFSWILFLLAQHPDVMTKLAEELKTKTSGETGTYDELASCEYLEWVIKESMRVLPASSYSQRITTDKAALGPLQLPAGTPVVFSQFMTHHREDLFVDPHVFRPARWKDIRPSAYEYLPFGAGPRMCIGAPLAMMEIRTALAGIVQRFHMQMVSESTVNGQVISTMLGPTSSVRAELIPPDQTSETVPISGSIHDLVDLPTAAKPAQRRVAA